MDPVRSPYTGGFSAILGALAVFLVYAATAAHWAGPSSSTLGRAVFETTPWPFIAPFGAVAALAILTRSPLPAGLAGFFSLYAALLADPHLAHDPARLLSLDPFIGACTLTVLGGALGLAAHVAARRTSAAGGPAREPRAKAGTHGRAR